jgi:tetratricopeptide (TPR) repeat protein
MNRRVPHSITRLAMAAVLLALAVSCSRQKAPTPAELQARFRALVDTLDTTTPGRSVEQLDAFLREAAKYEIADSVQMEMEKYRAATRGRYHQARSLAREGEFDAAESMLQDLALLPDTDDGQSARHHLEFEFYIEKARWLLVRQRFDEAEAVARELLTRDLNRFQADEAEKILDYTGHAGAATQMVSRQQARDACTQLIILLANLYINDGGYPAALSIGDLERLDPYASRFLVNSLSSIDEYSATTDHYSLVAVSKGGQRFRIVDGELKD